MEKFSQDDLVLQKGTEKPIMKILGKAVLFNVSENKSEQVQEQKGYYNCEWTDETGGSVRERFNEDELDLISKSEEEKNSEKDKG